MKIQLKKILKAVSHNQSLELSWFNFEKEFPDLLPILKDLNILTESTKDNFVKCHDCGASHEAFPLNGKFFMNCDSHEGFGVIEVKKQEIIKLRFQIQNFIKWLSNELEFAEDSKLNSENVWFLGSSNTKEEKENYYLVLTEEYSEALKKFEGLSTLNPIVFFLGDSLSTVGQLRNIVSINEFLSFTDSKMSFEIANFKKYFKKIITSEGEAILLDKDIVLKRDGNKVYLQLIREIDGSYRYSRQVYPLTYYIVNHLYETRSHNQSGISSKEMFSRKIGGIKQARTITTYIKNVNDICLEYGLIKPIYNPIKYKYSLNPSLDCFKEASPSPSSFNPMKVKI